MLEQIEKKHPFTIQGYKWQSRQEIGRSPNGVTYKVFKPSKNQYFAIRKFIFPQIKMVFQRFCQEFNKIKKIHSPYIIQYYQSQIFPDGGYIVMELCQYDLQTFIQKYERSIPQRVTQAIVNSIVAALEQLKQNPYYSICINPKNFLIKNRFVKFNPLSSGKYSINAKNIAISSAPLYMAPEVLSSKNFQNSDVDDCAEIWSIGVIAYELAIGILPFSYHNWDVYKCKHIEENVSLNQKIEMPKGLREFIRKCLLKDKKERSSWETIKNLPLVKECGEKITEYFQDKRFPKIHKVFRIPIDQTPEIAYIFNRIRIQKQNNTSCFIVQMKENDKISYDISQYLDYIFKNEPNLSTKYVKKVFEQFYEKGIQKHQLTQKFKKFKLDQDNEYVFMWKLAKAIKKKKIDIYKISQKFDFNKNKYIDETEIKTLINSILPNTNQAIINKVWLSLKQHYHGAITTDNMLKQLLQRLPSQEQQVKSRAYICLEKLKKSLCDTQDSNRIIFQYFDTNKDNRISVKEFSKLYNSFVGYEREEEILVMFKIIDKNGDGMITEKELNLFWKNM